MNYLKISMLCIMLSICFLHSTAQSPVIHPSEPNYRKSKLFNDLPQQMKLRTTDLESLFGLAVGTFVKAQVADNFMLQGTIVSKSDDADVKSVVVKSSNRQGAVLTFTKTHKADGTFSYLGRIISSNHADAYEIVQENGLYVMQKRSLNDLLSE